MSRVYARLVGSGRRRGITLPEDFEEFGGGIDGQRGVGEVAGVAGDEAVGTGMASGFMQHGIFEILEPEIEGVLQDSPCDRGHLEQGQQAAYALETARE